MKKICKIRILDLCPPAASHPCSRPNTPSTIPTHRPSLTERITDQISRWYGRWVGGTFSDTDAKVLNEKCER